MQFFLDSIVGDGDSENPVRPEHADGKFTTISLSPAPLRLVGAQGLTGTPVLDFGDTLDQPRLPAGIIRAFGNRLGITLEQTDFRGIIAEILLLHGKEDGSRWRKLRASLILPVTKDRERRHRIFLGGQSVYDAPVIVGASFTDDFNRGDENLEVSTNWFRVKGAMDVEANIAAIDTNKSIYRCVFGLDSDDHYTECVLTIRDDQPGINARMSDGDQTNWDAYHYRNNDGDEWQIFEVTNNSFNLIGSDTTTEPSVPYTMRVTANGSSISADLNGSLIIGPITDMTLTGQLETGFRDNQGAGTDWNNWEIADLAAGAASFIYQTKPLRAMIGR